MRSVVVQIAAAHVWICIHYDGPDKDIGPTDFECWNYESDGKLAELKKGLISDERDF
jgi:hypothetical protein